MSIFNMPADSLSSFILTLGSWIFTILLLTVYFPKTKMNYMRCKIYRLMLMVVTFILTTELISILFGVYGTNDSIRKILYIGHWLSILIWFILFYCHSICYFGDVDAPDFTTFFKQNLKIKSIVVFSSAAAIGYFLMPQSDLDTITTTYLSGLAEYYIISVLVIICAWIVLEAFVLIPNVPTRRKVSTLLIMFVMSVMVILQLCFPTICLYSIVTALQVFFIYFTIENPDIHMVSELEGLKKEIDRSNKAKTDFLSNMSHEIRTPMNAIVGFSDMLLNSPSFDSKSAKNDIQNISIAGNNLLDIINNILDISKIESGRESLEEKEYELSVVVNELSNIIKTRLNNNQVKLIVELSEGTPSKLYGDSTKLYQVLLNILSNSAKYTEVGKIKLSLQTEFIDSDFAILHFKIADTGFGIKKEDYDKMFEKFSRLDSAVSNEIEGTGLGLVITKKYVDLLDGKIWFESEFEVGTTFYVDVPQKVIDKNPITNLERTDTVDNTSTNTYIDCSKFNALVVDDNKLNIKVAERILKKYNFNVDSVDSGRECIFKVKSGNSYDIIFMDIMMPDMDGVETLHIIKKLDGYNIPPIIALTANAIAGVKEKYLREGFNDYLSKPINIPELDKVIHKHLDAMLLSSISPNRIIPVTRDQIEKEKSELLEKEINNIVPFNKTPIDIKLDENTIAKEEKTFDKTNESNEDERCFVGETKKTVEEPKEEIISEEKPAVVEEPKEEIISEEKPAVVEKQKEEIISEEKPAVVEEPKEEIISEEKTSVVEEPKEKIISEEKTLENDLNEAEKSHVINNSSINQAEVIRNSNNDISKPITKEFTKARVFNSTSNSTLSDEDTKEVIDNIVDKIEPIIDLVPNVDIKKDINNKISTDNNVEIELVKLSIKIDNDKDGGTTDDRK